MLQKKSFLFLTSICIVLVVWLISMMYCQRRPDAANPQKLVVSCGLREGLVTGPELASTDQNTPTTESNMSNILYFCFDDRTGNMLQSCKNKINDFATNLGQMNKKDLDSAYNSYVNEGGCFDKTSGQMLQPCKDAINHFATNFTQITKSDVDNGCGIRSVAVR